MVNAAPRLLVISLSFLFLLSISSSSSFAQSPSSGQKGSLEVNPAYVEVTLQKPNEEQTLDIHYTNHSSVPVILEIFPIDFRQANEHGGISFLGKDSQGYSYSLSSFLSFEANELTVEPGERRTFAVKVSNRANISPGGHYAAVVARLKGESDQTSVAPALSSLIFLKKLGGERFHLSIKDIDWPNGLFTFSIPQTIAVTLQNEGNVHVTPYGRAEITDMFGRLLYKGVLNTSSGIVLPEARRRIPLELKKSDSMLPISFNSFTLTGEDSLKKVRYTYQETFVYIHPGTLIFLPGIALGVWLVSRKFNRRKKKQES